MPRGQYPRHKRKKTKTKAEEPFAFSAGMKAEIAEMIAKKLKKDDNVVNVPLNRELVEGIDEILQSRGGNIQSFLELQMVGFVRSKAILGLEDSFTFGKYTGAPIQHVIANDLAYMYWLVVEQKSKKFKQEVYDAVVHVAAKEDYSRFDGMDF